MTGSPRRRCSQRPIGPRRAEDGFPLIPEVPIPECSPWASLARRGSSLGKRSLVSGTFAERPRKTAGPGKPSSTLLLAWWPVTTLLLLRRRMGALLIILRLIAGLRSLLCRRRRRSDLSFLRWLPLSNRLRNESRFCLALPAGAGWLCWQRVSSVIRLLLYATAETGP